MAERSAPAGSLVTFEVNSGNGFEVPADLRGVQLRIQEDIGLSLNSEFSEVFSRGVSNFEKVASDAFAAATGLRVTSQFKEFGFQTWRKTSPLAFSLTVTLRMKTDAYTDVIKPTRALLSFAIPDDTGVDSEGAGMVLPGPNILSLFGLTEGSGAGSAIIKCKIGWMNFSSVIVKKAEPLYSKNVDSNGFSIWSQVKLDIETVYTATRQMLIDMTPDRTD